MKGKMEGARKGESMDLQGSGQKGESKRGRREDHRKEERREKGKTGLYAW